MAQHRHTVNIQIKPTNHPILSRVLNDPTLRVMIFCSGESHGRQDIAFPHQSEIKINTGEVKANLRGLKNKPGSTRPVDITSALRLKIGHYVNSVEMTYALTTKAGGVGSQVRFIKNPSSPPYLEILQQVLSQCYSSVPHFWSSN